MNNAVSENKCGKYEKTQIYWNCQNRKKKRNYLVSELN